MYDVRSEGDGAKTLVKRGVRITGSSSALLHP
jgi:hypothetical protein